MQSPSDDSVSDDVYGDIGPVNADRYWYVRWTVTNRAEWLEGLGARNFEILWQKRKRIRV